MKRDREGERTVGRKSRKEEEVAHHKCHIGRRGIPFWSFFQQRTWGLNIAGIICNSKR
jgi:hypothetical protein